MMMMIAVSTGRYHDDARLIISAVLAVMVMMVVMMVELRLLDVLVGGGDRTRVIDDLQQGGRIRDRFKQVRE